MTQSQGDLLVRKSKSKANIIVTKKVAPKAVDRNRIKRIVRVSLESLNIKKGEFQIIVKRNIAGYKSNQVKGIISQLITK